MNGSIVSLLAEAVSKVNKDNPLVVMEAMKIEHTLSAPANGLVKDFYFAAGDLVEQVTELVNFVTDEI